MKKLWSFEGNCAKLKRNFALTFPDAKIFALTFPNAKIFTPTFPNAKIFAAHFPNAKIFALTFSDAKFFASFLQCENVIVRYFTPTLLDFYLKIFCVTINSLLVIS